MPVVDSNFNIELNNPCTDQKDHCLNCHSHFMAVRPHLTSVVVTKRFFKDVLDCANADFNELHKFEEHVNGCMIFRAKKEGMHIVYCVDKNMRIIFMRVFKNFKEYEKFLDDKREMGKLILHV